MPLINPSTILVYTLGELLGDGMVKLPFVQQLRKLYPQAHITWMAGQRTTAYKSVLHPLIAGDIDEVHELTMVGASWTQWFKPPWNAPKGGYDLIIDTQRRTKATLIVKRIPHKTFISPAMKWFFSDLKPTDVTKRPAHFAAQHTMLLELLSQKPVTLDYHVTLPDEYIMMGQEVRHHLIQDRTKWVLLAPGAGVRIKCWPLERFTALAMYLRAQGVGVSYILGPQELDMRAEIESHDPDASFPLQYLGEGPLKDQSRSIYTTMALANAADLCIANDAGVGHVFAATSTPLISLFGIVDEGMWAPLTPHLTILKGSMFDAHNPHVNAIPFDAVCLAVEHGLLSRSGEVRAE